MARSVDLLVEHLCPVCAEEGSLHMRTHVDEIPYFGEHTQVTLLCETCGWRQTDFLPSEASGPSGHRLWLSEDLHLAARVVRGASGTVRVPELDLEVSPGTNSHGYVSNVEGVLVRFLEIIDMLGRQFVRDRDDPGEDQVEVETQLAALEALREQLQGVREGEAWGSATVEVLDPRGHSAIAHEDAEHWLLDEVQLAELDAQGTDLIEQVVRESLGG